MEKQITLFLEKRKGLILNVFFRDGGKLLEYLIKVTSSIKVVQLYFPT
jgi:hypothetical protein